MRPALLLLLLFPLLIGTAAGLAWQHAGRDRYASLEAEGDILVGVVAGAALEAAEALTLAEQSLAARLASVARRADSDVARTRAPAADVLLALAREERVGQIYLFDPEGAPIAEALWPPRVPRGDQGPLGRSRRHELRQRDAAAALAAHPAAAGQVSIEGLRTNLFGTRERFGVLYGRREGGSLLVRANADELAELEERLGLQRMVGRMVELDSVLAVRLIAPTGSVQVLMESAAPREVGRPLVAARDVEIRGARHRVELDLTRAGVDASVARARSAILLGALLALAVSLGAALLLLRLDGARRREAAQAAAALAEERRLAEMGALAGLVTHEVNNPLNAIRLGLRVLEDARAGPAPVLETMKGEVERMAHTLEGYMSLARSEGRSVEVVGPDLLERVARRTAEEARRLGVAQGVEVAPGSLSVRGNPVVLDQALRNLVRNALQAAPRGSTVQLKWTPDERDPTGGVEISVTDAGPGFPADRDALLRLGASRRAGGHGLGLPLAKRFVESHGGRLELLDAPGGGARVVVRLPAALGGRSGS